MSPARTGARLPVAALTPGTARRLAPVWASLPADLRPVDDAATAHVVAVDGGPGWTAVAAGALDASRPPPVVVVDAPGPEDVDAVRALARRARETGTAVLLDRPWAAAPGVVAAAQRFGDRVADAVAVHVLATAPVEASASDHLAVEALGLLRAASGTRGVVVDAVRRLPSGVVVVGRLPRGGGLHLQVVRGGRGTTARLVAHSASAWTAVEVVGSGPGSRVTASSADADGLLVLPVDLEAAGRATWRRAAGAGGAAADLDDLADDLAAVATGR